MRSKIFRIFYKTVLYAAAFVFLGLPLLYLAGYGISSALTAPSNDRDWALDQGLLPHATYSDDGSSVTIHNVRNFAYESTTQYTPSYYTKTYDLSKISKVYYIVEPFNGFKGSAHTFLSFEFDNGTTSTGAQAGKEYVSISVEIRKEKGESFSALKGLFNSYEVMYVIADEKDAVKLRSNYRIDDVYVYPVKTTPQKARSLFEDMLAKANELKEEPEFYNTLFNTCTSKIRSHTNKITPSRIPFSYKILFPAYSDELAFDLGMIDTELGLEAARSKFKINERAAKYADSPDFSKLIRE